MDKQIFAEVEKQMNLDTNTLLVMLGSEGSIGATPGSPRDGKIVIANIKKRFQKDICKSEVVQQAYEKAGENRIVIAMAIMDCLSGALMGVSPITAAVLLVREGVDTLCEDIWRKA